MVYKVTVNSNSCYREYEGVKNRTKNYIINNIARYEGGEVIHVYDSKGRCVYCLKYDIEKRTYYRPLWVSDDEGNLIYYNTTKRRYE